MDDGWRFNRCKEGGKRLMMLLDRSGARGAPSLLSAIKGEHCRWERNISEYLKNTFPEAWQGQKQPLDFEVLTSARVRGFHP